MTFRQTIPILKVAEFTLSFALATAIGAPANASILGWNNGGGGSAALAANWLPAQVPVAADDLVWNLNSAYAVTFNATVGSSHTQAFRSGTVTVTASAPHTISNGLIVGDQGIDNAILTLTTGTLTCNATTTLGNVAGSIGRINVNDDDADLIIGNAADLFVGSNGAGVLSITGVGRVQVADQLIAGSNATSISTISVTGFSVAPIGNSVLEVLGTGESRIGQGGDADLTVDTGAVAHFAGDVIIANGTASSSSVTVQNVGLLNARFNVDGDLLIGRNSSATAAGVGSLNLNTGGTSTVGGDTLLGDPNGGTGTLHLGGGTFNGTGPVTVLAGSTINGFGTVNANITNQGNIQPSGTGLTIGGVLSNTTSNQIAGTKIHFAANGGYEGSGTCQAEISGDLASHITATRTLTIGNNSASGFFYLGSLNIGGNIVTLLDSNGAVLGGLTTINSGRIECPAGIGVQNGGTLKGDGLLVGTLTASGVIDPHMGNQLGGLITVQGDLNMNPSGIVDMTIGGSPGSSNNDRINVSGVANFGGTIRITLKNGFIPNALQQFIAVNAVNGRIGTFDNVITPTSCNGVTFVMVYSSTAAIVLIRPPDADANHDGAIDVDDLLVVINGWGQSNQVGAANVDGVDPVGVDDLLYVINKWGQCP